MNYLSEEECSTLQYIEQYYSTELYSTELYSAVQYCSVAYLSCHHRTRGTAWLMGANDRVWTYTVLYNALPTEVRYYIVLHNVLCIVLHTALCTVPQNCNTLYFVQYTVNFTINYFVH